MLSSAGLRRPQTQQLFQLQQIRGTTPICIDMAQLALHVNSRGSVGRPGAWNGENSQPPDRESLRWPAKPSSLVLSWICIHLPIYLRTTTSLLL